MNLLETAQSAERILVPKSGDGQQCIQDFTELTGIEVPEFDDRKLSVRSLGRTFWRVRGDDMPGYITRGWANVAIASTESRVEYGDPRQIAWMRIGEAVCGYSILAEEARAESVRERLTRGSRYPLAPLRLPATYPQLLNQVAVVRDLPVIALDVSVTGSGEALPALSGASAVADRVSTGETARQNGLVEVFKLCNLYSEIVVRRGDAQV